MQYKIPAPEWNGIQARLTAAEYRTLQKAFDHFNTLLFAGLLPQVLITLQRQRRARGYFSAKRFRRRGASKLQIHEIALNPDTFVGRSDEEILSTLVHEMVHVWQHEQGHPGRGRYHNKEWAAKMHSIGLMPSSTGEPGGKVTGQAVSHYILDDGAFIETCKIFLENARLQLESADEHVARGTAAGGTASQTRFKFTCPKCGLNVWAKPNAAIDCHSCSEHADEAVMMRANE